MNKRMMKQIEKEASDRVRMKHALLSQGHTLQGDETTEMLEELVLLTFALPVLHPPTKQFDGVISRSMSEIITEPSA